MSWTIATDIADRIRAGQGKPWPGKLAALMDQMYRVAKGKPASPAGSAVDETGSSNVPAW